MRTPSPLRNKTLARPQRLAEAARSVLKTRCFSTTVLALSASPALQSKPSANSTAHAATASPCMSVMSSSMTFRPPTASHLLGSTVSSHRVAPCTTISNIFQRTTVTLPPSPALRHLEFQTSASNTKAMTLVTSQRRLVAVPLTTVNTPPPISAREHCSLRKNRESGNPNTRFTHYLDLGSSLDDWGLQVS